MGQKLIEYTYFGMTCEMIFRRVEFKSLIFRHGAPATWKPHKTKCKTMDVVEIINNVNN